MPLFKEIEFDEARIGVWRLTEQPEELITEFSDEELSDDDDFRKYNNPKRKVEWLASRVLLKKMIGHEAAISYLPSGKPVLEHPLYKNISITHSRDFVAIIVSAQKKVGIDIEDSTRDFGKISQRFLSDFERGLTAMDNRLRCLFWCVKEAVFKLVGAEGVEFREQICVKPDEMRENQYFATFAGSEKRAVYAVNFEFIDESCLVWVVE